jgi:predicted Zn-dependent protease
MHYSLASVYVRVNRMDDARHQLETALKLKPNDFDANKMLGQVFLVEKTPTSALPYLQKASKLRPDATDIHSLLADTYTQLGQKSNADRERALAQRGGR